ncbi:response regulator transcription factor [Methanoregula sp.]|uniref:response regulator transcription factor n=1 Tax=Methanoregula sp. TaxID=2052170 RepID=UPI002C221899|nr:response regulator [Methanoregula sp.]HVP97339.1 response regulator [Methanoregula sp.]
MTRILIVDDDADILELLRLEFEDDPGCSADCTTDPFHALELAKNTPYDAVITDWRMPLMNGSEFARALRGQGCTSYIIIYSALEPGPEIQNVLETDADQYIFRRGNPDREFVELKESVRNTRKRGHAVSR